MIVLLFLMSFIESSKEMRALARWEIISSLIEFLA
jgi:hypothetical protein